MSSLMYSPRSISTSVVLGKEDNTDIPLEHTNFLRLSSLILKIGTRAVRCMFDIYNNPNSLSQTLKTNLGKLKQLRDKRAVNKDQWMRLFPGNGNVSSKNFDLSLMILLLIEVSGFTVPSNRGSDLPDSSDDSEGADLVRIKYYRNMIAHATSCYINNHDFSIKWKVVSQAIFRIGGDSLRAEVEALLTAPLDHQSYKDLYRELQHLRCDNVIPSNIQYLIDEKIKLWEKDDETFFQTKAASAVENAIDQNYFIMVTGPPGSGKSATVHHVALHLYKEKGYTICPVKSTKEIIDNWKPNIKQIFVSDDLFGVHVLDEAELNQWEKYQKDDTLTLCFQDSCTKIVVTARTHIARDEKISGASSLFKHVSITDESNCLSRDERLEIFRNHVRLRNRKDLMNFSTRIQDFTLDCFPLICRLYAADTESRYSIEDFFKRPLFVIGDDINELRKRNPEKYFCLVFVMIYDNNLDTSVFDFGKEDEVSKFLRKTLLELCGLPRSISRTVLKSKLDTLLNTYIVKEGSKYHFVHDIVHDAVVKHVGQLDSNVHRVVLNFCSSKFIKDRIRLTSVECKDTESCIVIGEDLESKWGDRLSDEIQKGDLYKVFTNRCLSSDKADRILADSLKKTKINEIMGSDSGERFLRDKSFLFDFQMKSKLCTSDCSAFHWAVLMGLKHVVKVTIQALPDQVRNALISDINVLLLATASGKEDMVKLFIDEGHKVNDSDHRKLTPLLVSATYGYDKIAKVLIDNRASVDTCDSNGCTPLFESSIKGYDKVVKILLESGSDVNKCNNNGYSPLYVSSRTGHDRVVKLLIKYGAIADKCNNHGESPLYAASCNGNEKVVKLLIESGADVNKRDRDSETPLEVASSNGYENIVKILKENGAV